MYSLYYSRIARKLGLAKTTDWGIAIRRAEGYSTIMGLNSKVEFDVINNTGKYWFADPLLFSDCGKTWLFVEAFNKDAHKGEIGYFEIVNGEAVNFKMVIETPTHMSYPFVFKHNNDYYMIPETGAARQIVLYRAKQFPDEWIVDTVLLEGMVFRDSTIIRGDNGMFRMISYENSGSNRFNMKNILTVFQLDMNNKKLLKESCFTDYDKTNRPAGPCFIYEGKQYRVSQKCNRAYGEAMYVYENVGDGLFKNDIRKNVFDGSNVVLPYKGKVVLTHTYSQAGGYEVIDFRCEI